MKYKTLCRLLVKLLGIYFLCEGITVILLAIGTVAENLTVGSKSQTWEIHAWYLGIRFMTGLPLGLFLIFKSGWVTDRLIPSNRPYCHECGYDLSHAPGSICPECGTVFRTETVDPEPHH